MGFVTPPTSSPNPSLATSLAHPSLSDTETRKGRCFLPTVNAPSRIMRGSIRASVQIVEAIKNARSENDLLHMMKCNVFQFRSIFKSKFA